MRDDEVRIRFEAVLELRAHPAEEAVPRWLLNAAERRESGHLFLSNEGTVAPSDSG